jgi:hypothetical protein
MQLRPLCAFGLLLSPIIASAAMSLSSVSVISNALRLCQGRTKTASPQTVQLVLMGNRPTIPTLVMFPILVWVYLRLAKKEEGQMLAEFGEAYMRYARIVPAFIPRGRRPDIGAA